MSYASKVFSAVVTDVTGGNPKLPKSEFKMAGAFPVIDQGRKRVAGYCDDETMLYVGRLPVVLFGDHTREIKFADQPFVLGADGVKILSTSPDLSPKFLFYYLKYDGVPSAGYSRHFKYLREKQVPVPGTLSEQERIVDLLEQAEELLNRQTQSTDAIARVLGSVFTSIFGPLSELSGRYSMARLDKGLAESTRNGLYKHDSFYGRGITILKMFNIKDGWLTTERLDKVEVTEREQSEFGLQSGDILINRVNTPQLVGKCLTVPAEGSGWVFESKNIRLRLAPDSISPQYVSFYLNTEYGHRCLTRGLKHAAGMATITASDILTTEIPLPPSHLQEQWDRCFEQVGELRKVTSKRQTQLESLFQALLHRAFDGRLTAKWREIHATELLAEMQHQSHPEPLLV